MAKYTLHNKSGDFMYDTTRTLKGAVKKCNEATYMCRVFETYYAVSPWKPWDTKLVEHGREVYKNYKQLKL